MPQAQIADMSLIETICKSIKMLAKKLKIDIGLREKVILLKCDFLLINKFCSK